MMMYTERCPEWYTFILSFTEDIFYGKTVANKGASVKFGQKFVQLMCPDVTSFILKESDACTFSTIQSCINLSPVS